VNGNATQLHQVLLNLCVNARDAMPSGGRIEVSAENAELDEVYERMHPEALPGPYVLITLSDNGTGIPPGELDKIFDPFFTTKPAGKGTGLGLSTTLGIIKSHGGFINVYSEVGKGTQFKIYLPAVTGGTVEAPGPERPEIPQGEGELILVVDDELSICEIARATLEAHGYRALVANDGTEAITRFVEHRDSIGLILIDIMMPYMDGPTTIRALQKLDPRVKIIATSGLSSNEELVRTTSGVRSFLVKPYTADKLLRAIRDVLHPAG
jgi:CheY-like chemotaxis protein